jgi:hypothetical protein
MKGVDLKSGALFSDFVIYLRATETKLSCLEFGFSFKYILD